MDRIQPTLRPSPPLCGWQRWQQLTFLHWPAPVDAIRQLVPNELELDLHDGTAYVGLVPFRMEGVVPFRWWPKSLAFRFLETNVRTYVHARGRPGVYFFSLDAASRLAVLAARWMWSLPYYYAHMQFQAEGDVLTYRCQRGAVTSTVRCRPGEPLGPVAPDSLEFFLLERYLLFVKRRGELLSGQVHHVPYPAHAAELLEADGNLISAAGLPCEGPPPLVHYSPGVEVEIFPLRRLAAG
ncbi:MAG: DUF2071 domain-containing protein [Planctomycetales bacterium]|nr:DUF2071 domain-containing protein [Planctomycetales bacterium]